MWKGTPGARYLDVSAAGTHVTLSFDDVMSILISPPGITNLGLKARLWLLGHGYVRHAPMRSSEINGLVTTLPGRSWAKKRLLELSDELDPETLASINRVS